MYRSVFIIILIIAAFSGYGQRFNGGAMAGMASSQVAGDTYAGYNKVGPLAGFFVNYYPSTQSSVQMELYYVQKGSRKSADVVEQDYESYLLRLNYVELPVFYRYHIGWFAIEAGPSLAFFMKGYEEKNGEDVNADDFANMTFQLNLGIMFSFARNWRFHIRTNNALTNLRNQTYTGHVPRLWTHGQFNDVIMFQLAYQFVHFGK
jgi:hypothetical protein